MQPEALELLAKKAGFSHVGFFPADKLQFRKEVRDMCASNRCRSYNHSWSCPPACGSLEAVRSAASEYTRGILLQTTVTLEDDFDYDAMAAGEVRHKASLDTFAAALSADPGAHCLVMSAGTCTRCRTCTYPDAPCRFPDRLYISMEAYGLIVSDVCRLADTPYYYGQRTLTYSACVLFA